MGGLAWWLEWPFGPIRVGVAFLVAAAALFVAVNFPALIGDLNGEASRNSSLSYSDREIAGGNGVVADQAAVYEARGRIPEDDTYRVAVGSDFPGGTELTVPYVDSYFRYFLMPRRPADDAPWIICYGCDLEPYGSRATIVWTNDEGISIARIRR